MTLLRKPAGIEEWVRVGGSESQFLGKLIRSQGSPRRREGHIFFPLYSLVLVTYDVFFFKPRADKTTQLQLCTKDFIYKTTMYPA